MGRLQQRHGAVAGCGLWPLAHQHPVARRLRQDGRLGHFLQHCQRVAGERFHCCPCQQTRTDARGIQRRILVQCHRGPCALHHPFSCRTVHSRLLPRTCSLRTRTIRLPRLRALMSWHSPACLSLWSSDGEANQHHADGFHHLFRHRWCFSRILRLCLLGPGGTEPRLCRLDDSLSVVFLSLATDNPPV